MKRIFITGITGFLGSHTAKALIDAGHKVTGLVRNTEIPKLLKRYTPDIVEGDINTPDTYKDILKKTDVVVNCAALAAFNAPLQDYMRVNYDGTKALFNAAENAGVSLFVHIGTRGTFGPADPPESANENTPKPDPETTYPYIHSKALADAYIKTRLKEMEMKGVILSPTSLFGVGDERPTPTGNIIMKFLEGKIKTYMDGGINVIDVEDAAQAIKTAVSSPNGCFESGETFFLGNANINLKDLFDTLADITGKSKPFIKVPYHAAMTAAWIMKTSSGFTGKPAFTTPDKVISVYRRHAWCSSEKAVNALSLPQTPIDVTLRKTADWFIKRLAQKQI